MSQSIYPSCFKIMCIIVSNKNTVKLAGGKLKIYRCFLYNARVLKNESHAFV